MKNKIEKAYQPAYSAWSENPNPTTTSDLLKEIRPVIDSAVKTFGGAAAGSPTLRSHARRISMESFNTYDPMRGPLKTHLMSNLQGLRRKSQQEQQIISVPEQVALDLYQTEESGKELEDKLGRTPSDEELADFTGVSLKRLSYIRQARRPVAQGTIMQSSGDAGMYMPAVKAPQESSAAWVELIYSDLNKTDQYILERSMGLHGHQPQAQGQIAQALRLSAGAVSQRLQRIQAQLDKRDELEML